MAKPKRRRTKSKRRNKRAPGRSIPRRNVVITGRRTSVTLEDEFWRALNEIAATKSVRVSDLVSTFNKKHRTNLSTAVRLFVLNYYRGTRLMPRRPLKRSIKLTGRTTSVTLEDAFWKALKEIAATKHVSVQGLISMINNERQHANLSSVIRVFVLNYYRR